MHERHGEVCLRARCFHSIPLHHKGPPWIPPIQRCDGVRRTHNASLIRYPGVPQDVQPSSLWNGTQWHSRSLQRQNKWQSRWGRDDNGHTDLCLFNYTILVEFHLHLFITYFDLLYLIGWTVLFRFLCLLIYFILPKVEFYYYFIRNNLNSHFNKCTLHFVVRNTMTIKTWTAIREEVNTVCFLSSCRVTTTNQRGHFPKLLARAKPGGGVTD